MTASDICFPQELDYSTSRVHTESSSANLYTGRSRWKEGGVDAARRAAHAVLCQRYAGEVVEEENRENAASDASKKGL